MNLYIHLVDGSVKGERNMLDLLSYLKIISFFPGYSRSKFHVTSACSMNLKFGILWKTNDSEGKYRKETIYNNMYTQTERQQEVMRW